METVLLFALTALLLAGIGMYGTISYIVSGRTRDIGTRIALGAQRKTILHMVLSQGLRHSRKVTHLCFPKLTQAF
jgi:ABC-type antimicrobial peptide transport system permease subunit